MKRRRQLSKRKRRARAASRSVHLLPEHFSTINEAAEAALTKQDRRARRDNRIKLALEKPATHVFEEGRVNGDG